MTGAGGTMFRKLLLAGLLLILVTVGVLDFLVTRYTTTRETLAVEMQLAGQARILSSELERVPAPGLAAWVREAAARSTRRITVIDPAGAVLGDSEANPATMENHATRPEFREALSGRQGVSVRRSATLSHDLLYLAVPVLIEGRLGYALRLAVPLEHVSQAVAEVRRRIFQASLAAALCALAIAFLFSRSLSRRIRQVQAFADGLANEQFSGSLPAGPRDELGDLARSLNHMAGQLRDLVERLRLESARREAILAGMVEGVLAVDHELCVTFCNQAFARVVGARHPVTARLPVLEVVRDPAFLDMLAGVLAKGEVRKQHLQLTAAEGRSFEIQAAPLESHGQRGAIVILHDVTDLERLERVRRDFVANVSHELRTPLAAIQGYTETLLDGALEDRENNRKFLEIIKSHTIRLNHIASDLLSLSELESGERGGPLETVSIRDAVESAVRNVEAEARLRSVTIHQGEVSDVWVRGSGLRLEQALVNLLDNAVKFNHPGGEVRIEASRSDDAKVRITVSDNGIGIPSEDLPRVFERFYRVDKSRSREVGGTGLGLAIVKHAIESMGGSVSAESQLGKGSKFTLSMPGTQNL